jgi:pSer/pThr/pTyr-binding forkhead associated (FHA) protein
MSFCLKVLASPAHKLDGLKLPIAEGDNLVGRVAPPAQIQLEGSKVSKKHCVIKAKGSALKVEDLRSSNGVFVNGKKVEVSELKEKDRLVIGEFVLEVAVK